MIFAKTFNSVIYSRMKTILTLEETIAGDLICSKSLSDYVKLMYRNKYDETITKNLRPMDEIMVKDCPSHDYCFVIINSY